MNDRWSLDILYTGFEDTKWKEDLKNLEEVIQKFDVFTQNIEHVPPQNALKEGILLLEEMESLGDQLFVFAELKQTANTLDSTSSSALGTVGQMMNKSTVARTKFAKYVANQKNLLELLQTDEVLKEYTYYFEMMQQDDLYMLDAKVEEALAKMNLSGGNAWSDLQSYLTSTVNVSYLQKDITLSEVRNLAYNADKNVRKAAYEAEVACYEQIKDSVAFALNSIKMQDLSECELRGFSSPLNKTLYFARMQRETLNALLEAMKEYMPNFQSYLAAKAKALGYEKGLPWYELFAPMGKMEKTYSIEEAKDYLLKVFSSFSKDITETIQTAFDKEWIDVYPRKGKVGGAFCEGLNSKKEFRILTNFSGSFSDIVTLAHELGHGYHDTLVHKNRLLNMSYSMPVAETASTFNENVITNYAIDHAKNEDEKLSLIEGQLSDVTQIICDIYSRFLFESKVVENRNDKFMPAEELCDYMLEAQKKAYGLGVDDKQLHPYMWICKGHYYSAGLGFYNYPYAFGGLFARGLYAKYKKEGQDFIAKYNKMLKNTPTMSVEDVAKICDIDLTSKEFWLMSLHSYDETIETFKNLVSKA